MELNLNTCRVHDECLDSNLKRELEYEGALFDKLDELSPNVRISYFPIENKYAIYSSDNEALSELHDTRLQAIKEALDNLEDLANKQDKAVEVIFKVIKGIHDLYYNLTKVSEE